MAKDTKKKKSRVKGTAKPGSTVTRKVSKGKNKGDIVNNDRPLEEVRGDDIFEKPHNEAAHKE